MMIKIKLLVHRPCNQEITSKTKFYVDKFKENLKAEIIFSELKQALLKNSKTETFLDQELFNQNKQQRQHTNTNTNTVRQTQ